MGNAAENQNMVPAWQNRLASAKRKFNEIVKATQASVNYDSEAMFAMQSIQRSDKLQRCNPDSVRDAIINVASCGISLNPALKLAFLVPRDGLCCLDISAQGLVQIATDSGSILWAKADVVKANDKFTYRGFSDRPIHEFNPFATEDERGPVIGAYCVAKLHNGDELVEIMSREQIEEARKRSKAKSGPWFEWFDEMCKKTVIKRAYKSWPKTKQMSQAIHVLDEHEGIDFEAPPRQQPTGQTYEGEVVQEEDEKPKTRADSVRSGLAEKVANRNGNKDEEAEPEPNTKSACPFSFDDVVAMIAEAKNEGAYMEIEDLLNSFDDGERNKLTDMLYNRKKANANTDTKNG